MYDKVPTSMNFVEREKKVEKFWEENHIFEKSIDNRKKGETYTFYDGPPTANGKPHIGHVVTRVIKDMIPRYQHHEGQNGSQKSRLGYPRSSGRAGSRENAGSGRKRADRAVRTGALHQTTVKRAYGNTKVCGRISPTPLVSGLIWSIPTLPTRTTSSSPSGGH